MPSAVVYTDSIPIYSRQTGLRVTSGRFWLLPDGGTSPGDLIELTQDSILNWYWNFPGTITNGTYALYTGNPGSQEAVAGAGVTRIIRGGVISGSDTDFAY